MRKIKLVFNDSSRTPVTFQGNSIYWDVKQKDLFILYAEQVENGKILSSVEIGRFKWKDVLYIVNNDHYCTAF